MGKIENLNKVKGLVLQLRVGDIFTIEKVRRETGLNYDQCARILKGLEEFELIKYSESTKSYMRL